MATVNKPGWKSLPEGDILEPGTAEAFHTGDWRSECPVWDDKKCIHDLQCWIYCPDNAITVKDGKMVGIDYRYCKGCGICAKICPEKVSAIKMISEEEFRNKNK